MSGMTFSDAFFQRSCDRPKITPKQILEPKMSTKPPRPSKKGPQGFPKTHFPTFLEFLIFDAPLGYNCCLRQSRCSKFAPGRNSKTKRGRAPGKTGQDALLSQLFPEIVSKWLPQGVPGRVREPPFCNFLRSWLPCGRPPVTRGPPASHAGASSPIFIDFESMWARFCHVF